MRRGGAWLSFLAAAACGPALAPPDPIAVTAPSASTKQTPTPCEITRELRAQVPALVREGRVDRVARSAKRADALCPATESETAAARDAAIAELARGGDPDTLFDEAIAARAHGESANAQTLNDRALAELERRSTTPAVAEERRAVDGAAKPIYIDDDHVLFARMGGAYVVHTTTGRAWGPLETGDIVDRIALDPSHANVAIVAGMFGATQSRFRAWDWKSGRAVGEAFDAMANPKAYATSPDGNVLTVERVASDKHTVALWDWSKKRIVAEVAPAKLDPPDSSVMSVHFSPDGSLVATTWSNNALAVFETKTGASVFTDTPPEGVSSVVFSPNGDWLGWIGDTSFGAIDLRARVAMAPIARTDFVPYVIGFDPKSRSLLAAAYDRSVCIVDLATKRRRIVVPREARPPPARARDESMTSLPASVTMSADGKLVVMTLPSNATMRVDAQSGRVLPDATPPRGYTGETPVVVTRDGAIEVSIDSSGASLHGVDTKTRAEVWSTPWTYEMSVTSNLAPDGTHVVAIGSDVVVLDAKTGARRTVPNQAGPLDTANEEMFDTTTRSLAFAMNDGSVLRFDAVTGALVESRPPAGERTNAHVVPRVFYTNAPNDTAQIDLASPPVKLEKSAHDLLVVALSPNATLLAAYQYTSLAPAPRIHGVRIWNAKTGKLLHELAGHSNPIRWLVFSPDGRRLATATGGGDPSIRIWDVASGAELQVLGGLLDFPSSIAFSPDSGRLAASGSKGMIKVFEVATGRVVQTIATPLENTRVAFDPDGTTVSGLADKRFVTWGVDGGARVREVDLGRAGRRFTMVPGRDLVALSGETDLALLGRFSGQLVLAFRPIPGGAIAFARDGRVELIGDRDKARAALVCRVGNRVFPFSLCEERLSEPHVFADALALP